METYSLAQPYDAIARIPVGPNVGIWGASIMHDIRHPVYDWMVKPPYSESSGGVYGENPTVSVIQFYVTSSMPFPGRIRKRASYRIWRQAK